MAAERRPGGLGRLCVLIGGRRGLVDVTWIIACGVPMGSPSQPTAALVGPTVAAGPGRCCSTSTPTNPVKRHSTYRGNAGEDREGRRRRDDGETRHCRSMDGARVGWDLCAVGVFGTRESGCCRVGT